MLSIAEEKPSTEAQVRPSVVRGKMQTERAPREPWPYFVVGKVFGTQVD
jgi:hypothetical protein